MADKDALSTKEAMQFLYEAGMKAQKDSMEGQLAELKEKQNIRDIDGVPYVWSNNRNVWVRFYPDPDLDAKSPEPFRIYTLDGLLTYINQDPEGILNGDVRYILHVTEESEVVLLSPPSKNNKDRNVIASVKAHVPYISFGKYMDIDSFNTMLLSMFVETDARKTLFSVTKAMIKEQSASVTDDGVGQVVTVRQGVSMASNVTFQNPVPLRPRRTFTEIEQPESNFTLRVNDEAHIALFESDGGAWKNQAVADIAKYLAQHITNQKITIIA